MLQQLQMFYLQMILYCLLLQQDKKKKIYQVYSSPIPWFHVYRFISKSLTFYLVNIHLSILNMSFLVSFICMNYYFHITIWVYQCFWDALDSKHQRLQRIGSTQRLKLGKRNFYHRQVELKRLDLFYLLFPCTRWLFFGIPSSFQQHSIAFV